MFLDEAMNAGPETGTRFKILDLDLDDARWDRFVLAHPDAAVYHHSAWAKILSATYDYTPLYISMENASTGKMIGGLPLMMVKSRFTGIRLSSLPFAAYCDPLLEKGRLSQFITFIFDRYPRIDYLELKFRHDQSYDTASSRVTDYMTHILEITRPMDELFQSFHKTSVQQRIRRAKREKLTFRLGHGEGDIRSFYHLETATRKKHGLPPAPISFFFNLWRYFQKEAFVFLPMIEYRDKVIAAAILLRFRDTFHFEYSASDRRFLKLSPNQLLIWESIKLAREENARFFDFGRSSADNHSLVEFKERWNAMRIPLYYHYMPPKNSNSAKGAWRRILESVNRFMPQLLLRIQGKLIYPHIG